MRAAARSGEALSRPGPSGSQPVLPSILMSIKITPLSNGPLRVEGEFEICDPTGAAFGLAGRTVISLCRCGHSANKPFCDGSHNSVGFSDTVIARELPPPKPKIG